jgi:hypothetical protein
MKEYAVNGDVLQKILTYLAGRPYVEVHELVKGIQNTSRELLSEAEAALHTKDVGPGTIANTTGGGVTGSNGTGGGSKAASA